MKTLAASTPSAAPPAARQRRLYRAWALALVLLGLALLAYNLRLLPPGPAGIFGPLLAAAALVLLLGRALARFSPAAFAFERGVFESGEVQARAALADIRLGAFAGASQLAVGEFSSFDGPGLRAEGKQACLRLDSRAALPLLFGDWSISLAKNLPWRLRLRLGLGHASLNLRDLNVAGLELRSLGGDVDLALPAQGQCQLDLSAWLGDVRLRAPEAVGVRLKLLTGRPERARLDGQRFLRLSRTEWETPDFERAPSRLTLNVRLGLGELEVV